MCECCWLLSTPAPLSDIPGREKVVTEHLLRREHGLSLTGSQAFLMLNPKTGEMKTGLET